MEVSSNSKSSSTPVPCMIAFGDNTNNNNNNNRSSSSNGVMYPMMMMPLMSSHHHQHEQHHADASSSDYYYSNRTRNIPLLHHSTTPQQDHHHLNTKNNTYFMDNSINNGSSSSATEVSPVIKAKIMAHPHYNRLLAAYVNCQKVGAPPEVIVRLEEACSSASMVNNGGSSTTSCLGEDPALDQFMEAYCEMLIKYEQELSKPFKEAMLFLQRVESQFKALSFSPSSTSACVEASDHRSASSEEDLDANNDTIDPQAEDRELKGQLLRKYSGYLGSLKQEFMKKRKKGKLPKEARQQLLDWWSRHYKWPYPSEQQKLALADSTGLDQKQINNWFINQRKRHWKPSEDMQFVVMDATHSHYYMDNVMGNPFPMDISPSLL